MPYCSNRCNHPGRCGWSGPPDRALNTLKCAVGQRGRVGGSRSRTDEQKQQNDQTQPERALVGGSAHPTMIRASRLSDRPVRSAGSTQFPLGHCAPPRPSARARPPSITTTPTSGTSTTSPRTRSQSARVRSGSPTVIAVRACVRSSCPRCRRTPWRLRRCRPRRRGAS